MVVISKSINFGVHTLKLEVGNLATQANASVLVNLGGTVVLVTMVVSPDISEQDFFPLRIDYQERGYASGKIPGGFFKREGRSSEREILISRLIDRPLRPLFAEDFHNEVQITASLLSVNPDVMPDIVAMIGASVVATLSGVPFAGPIGAARVGYKDGNFILNPTNTELQDSLLDLVVAGTETSVLMVESQAKELPEDLMLQAVMFGHKSFVPVIECIKELEVAKKTFEYKKFHFDNNLLVKIKSNYCAKIEQAYEIKDKIKRTNTLREIKKDVIDEYIDKPLENNPLAKVPKKDHLFAIIETISSDIVRTNILKHKKRIDGRKLDEVRNISSLVGVLENTHGSAIFNRGETQALAVVTLGTSRDAQIIETYAGEQKETFMLHYNFPPFCVGEIGNIGSPKRREIGHGNLAKRALSAVLPSNEDFPYVIRIVSEILSSNGSSSMATVCGTSLALMDAGVPIKGQVSGIAMGLIKEGNDFVVISDILGDEDHLGDMDFKVAGTINGITALQMDIKISGITEEIMSQALAQAKVGRMHILEEINKTINMPRKEIAKSAPCMLMFNINPEKIRDVIGKGGATIKALVENTGATIDIEDDGSVQIASPTRTIGEELRTKIEYLTTDVEIDKIYEGKVVRIAEFGAFVNILPGKDGLLHISQIANYRVRNVSDELSEGQMVRVKVIDIDRQGRIKLSMKDLAME